MQNVSTSVAKQAVVTSDVIDVVKPDRGTNCGNEWNRVLLPDIVRSTNEYSCDQTIVTQNYVCSIATVQFVVAINARHNVMATGDVVVTRTTIDDVVALLTQNKVIAGIAVNFIVSGSAIAVRINGQKLLVARKTGIKQTMITE